jgi:hypothetical protein
VTFIEVHINEDESTLEKLIRDAHTSLCDLGEWSESWGAPCRALATFRFGRIIVWRGRMFQQLEFSPGGNPPTEENPVPDDEKIFRLWNLPAERARMQVGSMRGEVFTIPLEPDEEPAARIKEGGRCGSEYLIRPFHYSDYHRDA